MDEKNFNKDKIFNYWKDSSENDYLTMTNLYKSKDYHWSLFIGHLVIEKLLKAEIVKKQNRHAPFTHDLRIWIKKKL